MGLPDAGRVARTDRRTAGASVRREEHHDATRPSAGKRPTRSGRGRAIDAGSQVVGETLSGRRENRSDGPQSTDSGGASAGQSGDDRVARNLEELRRRQDLGLQRYGCPVSRLAGEPLVRWSRHEPDRLRVVLQFVPAVPAGVDAVLRRVPGRRNWDARLRADAQPHGVRDDRSDVRSAHVRADRADDYFRTSSGDESVFDRRLHRLGNRAAQFDF